MRVWLDDLREPPMLYDHWAKSSDEVINLIISNKVSLLSLDFDLGMYDCGDRVLKFIENYEYNTNKICNFEINIHSQNPEGVRRMNLILDSIYRNRKRKIDDRINKR